MANNYLSYLSRTGPTLGGFFSRMDYNDLELIFQSGTKISGFLKFTMIQFILEVIGLHLKKLK